MYARQKEFRLAAEYVARALADVGEVQKVVLFGSVSRLLEKEVPRFSNYRRYRIELAHECSDVDIAVWVSNLDGLKSLQKARSKALNLLLQEKDIGVAHHQVDIFIVEPVTSRYLGRLCIFGKCPKGKKECLVPACGSIPFLRKHEDFSFREDAFAASNCSVLFERGGFCDSPSA